MTTAMPKYLNTQLGLIYLYKSQISSKTFNQWLLVFRFNHRTEKKNHCCLFIVVALVMLTVEQNIKKEHFNAYIIFRVAGY